jgi:hypothetical protein
MSGAGGIPSIPIPDTAATCLVIPEKTLRLTGGLGPLQAMGATGALTFALREASPTTTTVIAEYSVVGYSHEGLASIAGAVDQVLGEQMKRYATK